MRDHFTADWAFGTISTFEGVVEKHFRNDAHKWPLLRAFDFDAYTWNAEYLILVFHDKFSGIPAGPSIPKPLEDQDMPKDAPTPSNIHIWQKFIRSKFDVREQDAVLILPIVDGGSVDGDWALFSEQDKQLWRKQIDYNIKYHLYYVKGFRMENGFVIPPGYEFLSDVFERFFQDHPNYDKNVFIMTRFDRGNRLLVELDTELRTVLRGHGLNPVRADDKMYLRDRNLWNNVCTCMICCKYGIAILEDRVADEFNPNVALEYGFMRALDKPTLLLADRGFRNLRADIIGTLREPFDITDIHGTIASPVETWLSELGLVREEPERDYGGDYADLMEDG